MERLSNNQKGIAHILLIVLILVLLLGGGYYYLTQVRPDLIPALPVPKKQTELRDVDLTKEAEVSIAKNGFTPQTITIKKGTQVTFINKDTNSHHIASDPHPTHTLLPNFNSKSPLSSKSTYSYIFETVGIYTYHDHLTPFKFKGTVVVE